MASIHMAWTPRFEPRPHWWEASALTTAPASLPQYTSDLNRHILANTVGTRKYKETEVQRMTFFTPDYS